MRITSRKLIQSFSKSVETKIKTVRSPTVGKLEKYDELRKIPISKLTDHHELKRLTVLELEEFLEIIYLDINSSVKLTIVFAELNKRLGHKFEGMNDYFSSKNFYQERT